MVFGFQNWLRTSKMPYFWRFISKSWWRLGKKLLYRVDQWSKLHLWLNAELFTLILKGLYYVRLLKGLCNPNISTKTKIWKIQDDIFSLHNSVVSILPKAATVGNNVMRDNVVWWKIFYFLPVLHIYRVWFRREMILHKLPPTNDCESKYLFYA